MFTSLKSVLAELSAQLDALYESHHSSALCHVGTSATLALAAFEAGNSPKAEGLAGLTLDRLQRLLGGHVSETIKSPLRGFAERLQTAGLVPSASVRRLAA